LHPIRLVAGKFSYQLSVISYQSSVISHQSSVISHQFFLPSPRSPLQRSHLPAPLLRRSPLPGW
ncbi:MAG: hypothetical protein ACKPH4_28780, partial [Microcystis panniformis]